MLTAICYLHNLTKVCITSINCKSYDQMLSRMEFDVKDSFASSRGSALISLHSSSAPLVHYCKQLAHDIEIECRDVRDPPIESEQALQSILIGMIRTPGGQNDEGGQTIRNLLTEFLGGFSLRPSFPGRCVPLWQTNAASPTVGECCSCTGASTTPTSPQFSS